MQGALQLGARIAERLGTRPTVLGAPSAPIAGRWDVELEAARESLLALAARYAEALAVRSPLLTVMGRCAAALATLPVVARHHPEACIVWFDAHGDLNTPDTSTSGYLGGLVISGACGLWNSGLGGELELSNVVLVGARDLDPAEAALIEAGRVNHVPVGPDLAERLTRAIAGRAVYVHLDCDVLEPGVVPTEYQVPGGLSPRQLRSAAEAIAAQTVIGLEIAEFEATWPDGRAADPETLLAALEPLLQR
jgi:arginase